MIKHVMKSQKIKLIIFFALYFIFSICINVAHPVTPDYINSLNIPEYWFGLFYASMALGQVIGGITWGYLSDKIGRKWILISGIIGYCLAQAGFGFINQWLALIILFRFLAGLFAAAPVTLFISMALDFANDQKAKARNLMILSSFSILGQSVAYEIGGSIHVYLNATIQQVFLVQIGIGVAVALIFALTIKDIEKEPVLIQSEAKANKARFSFKNFAHLNYLIYILIGALLVLTIGQVLIDKYFDKYIVDIGFKSDVLGHYVLITGVIAALANLIFIPLIKKAKNKKLAILLTSFVGASAILTFITFLVKTNNIMYLLFTTHLTYIVIKSMILPLEQNELASYSNPTNNGQIMGARQTILSLGKVIGPVIGSAIYIAGSPIIFVTAASIILGSLLIYIIYFIIKYKHKQNTQVE